MPKRRKNKNRVTVATPKVPFSGDHGPNTAAQRAGTIIEAVPDDMNNLGRRRRVSQIEFLHRQARHKLSLRQYGAANKVMKVYSDVERLTSGGPLREAVDASPKPDAAVARQVDAMSAKVNLMAGVTDQQRRVIEWVCHHNWPLGKYPKSKSRSPWQDLCAGLDQIADKMRL